MRLVIFPQAEAGHGCSLRQDPRRPRDRRCHPRRRQGRGGRVRSGAGRGQGRSRANESTPLARRWRTSAPRRSTKPTPESPPAAPRPRHAPKPPEQRPRAHIHAAVADVSSRAAELATGRRPDADTVTGIVAVADGRGWRMNLIAFLAAERHHPDAIEVLAGGLRDAVRHPRLGDRLRPAVEVRRSDGEEGHGRPHGQDPGRARCR